MIFYKRSGVESNIKLGEHCIVVGIVLIGEEYSSHGYIWQTRHLEENVWGGGGGGGGGGGSMSLYGFIAMKPER
jgi:hypothetical protein